MDRQEQRRLGDLGPSGGEDEKLRPTSAETPPAGSSAGPRRGGAL